jgi:enamine deaminase RidA (YjgF/YER057c/UK114 family)
MTLVQKLQSLNIALPKLAGPFGAYVPAKRSGNLIFVAGQLPMKDGKLLAVGAAPSVCSMDDARLGARQCVINALAAVASLGEDVLNSLSGVLRVGAFVQSDDDFKQQPQVANAASELLQELFGPAGQHVRVAVGVNTLPMDAAVEIEFVFEI